MKDLISWKWLIRFAVIAVGLRLLIGSWSLSFGILCLLIAADRAALAWRDRKERKELSEEDRENPEGQKNLRIE